MKKRGLAAAMYVFPAFALIRAASDEKEMFASDYRQTKTKIEARQLGWASTRSGVERVEGTHLGPSAIPVKVAILESIPRERARVREEARDERDRMRDTRLDGQLPPSIQAARAELAVRAGECAGDLLVLVEELRGVVCVVGDVLTDGGGVCCGGAGEGTSNGRRGVSECRRRVGER